MGDFSANFKRPESGIYTAEGNVAGSRAAFLSKQREAEQALMEEKTNQIRNDAVRSKKNIHEKFANISAESASDQAFRASTVGLVSAKEFKEAQLLLQGGSGGGKDKEREEEEKLRAEMEKKKKRKLKREKKKRKNMLSMLSFGQEEAEADEIALQFEKKSRKDPTVDTSFLPDKFREEEAKRERERLKSEWIAEQERMKKEKLEIIYSYWDGSGHRRRILVTKGTLVGEFLELVRKDLASEFREMVNASADALMYVKEDLIIPSDITFYDLIATKARGKSGPLFHFDVHDDVRIGPLDSRVEKDESHPGKVVERRWYDRNKHIFPASRWEVYDPGNEHTSYTIHGK